MATVSYDGKVETRSYERYIKDSKRVHDKIWRYTYGNGDRLIRKCLSELREYNEVIIEMFGNEDIDKTIGNIRDNYRYVMILGLNIDKTLSDMIKNGMRSDQWEDLSINLREFWRQSEPYLVRTKESVY
jgi:predicted DNA-binding protein (UPF0278 family)